MDLSAVLSSLNEYGMRATDLEHIFLIQCSPYHLFEFAVPNEGATSKFAQLNIYDAEHELQNRDAVVLSINIAILEKSQEMMHRLNSFVCIFMNMAQAANKAEGVPNPRRYNRRTDGSEIAAIIIDSENNDISLK
ncbi:hypothetical protein A0J61_10712 [Choanephora cucurbitarum]|uniref:Uncharacterized protein n=1 Tax=Choanephora cucurbitarum TaxID=101091 RepID=A0A1C7MXX5_9FUNG|nr:hypothetical protein A0J61_10712 [Choanephora cucurbitarum]